MGAENALLYGAGVYLIDAAQHRELGGNQSYVCDVYEAT